MASNMQRWQAWLALLTGMLLAAAAAMHAFGGWPMFHDLLDDAGVDAEVMEGLRVGWYLGSVSLLAFGLIALSAGISALRGKPAPQSTLAWGALMFLGYGTWAFVSEGYETHFLLFIGFGVGMGLCALPLKKSGSAD